MMFRFVFATMLIIHPKSCGKIGCCPLPCVSNLWSCITRKNKTSNTKIRTINVEPFRQIYAYPLEPVSRHITSALNPIIQPVAHIPSGGSPSHLQSIPTDLPVYSPTCASITFNIPDQKSIVKIPKMLRHQCNPDYIRLKANLLYMHSVQVMPSTQVDENREATLLILNGRYTLYDAVSALDIEAKRALLQSDCLCFESMNYLDTVNVIRPGFLNLILTLNAFNAEDRNSSHVDIIVYVGNSMVVMDELISVLAFIETHCNEHEASITFRGLQFAEKDLLTLWSWINVMKYSKVIIVDHEGPSAWCGHGMFQLTQQMKMKMMIFQPVIFKFETFTVHKPSGMDFHFVDRKSFHAMIGDTYFRRIGTQMIRNIVTAEDERGNVLCS